MKKLMTIGALATMLSACSGEALTIETTSQDSVKTDSLLIVPVNSPINSDLLNKFSSTAALPFMQDTTYLFDMEPEDEQALTAEEAKYLTFGFVDSDISWSGMLQVDQFIFFDSLKDGDTYDAYVEDCSIGMTVYSEAYVAQKVVLNDSTTLLLWIVRHGTADSCPYGSGTILYASVLKNNCVTSCTIVGEDYGGADPPVWSEMLSLVSVTGESISVWKRDRSCGGDTDEEGNELVDESTQNFNLTIDLGGMWIVEELTTAEQ